MALGTLGAVYRLIQESLHRSIRAVHTLWPVDLALAKDADFFFFLISSFENKEALCFSSWELSKLLSRSVELGRSSTELRSVILARTTPKLAFKGSSSWVTEQWRSRILSLNGSPGGLYVVWESKGCPVSLKETSVILHCIADS